MNLQQALVMWKDAFSYPKCGDGWPSSEIEEHANNILKDRESTGDGWQRHNAACLGVNYLQPQEVQRFQEAHRQLLELGKKLQQKQEEKYLAMQDAVRQRKIQAKEKANQLPRYNRPIVSALVIGECYTAKVSYQLSKNTFDLAMINGELVEVIGVSDGDLVKIESHKSGKAFGKTFTSTGSVIKE